MPLRKAINDLREVTLGALPGRWRKMLYFAGLRRNRNEYSHWGFKQKFGKDADAALREAHESLYCEVLRAPLPELMQDCEENGVKGDVLAEKAATMLPITAEKHSDPHFRYILTAVRELLKSRKQRH